MSYRDGLGTRRWNLPCGNGPNVLKRVVAFGDGWFPNRIPPDDQMIARVEELQQLSYFQKVSGTFLELNKNAVTSDPRSNMGVGIGLHRTVQRQA